MTSPYSGERLCFSSLDDLFDFLRQETQNFTCDEESQDTDTNSQSTEFQRGEKS
jgi:hypothetical protein